MAGWCCEWPPPYTAYGLLGYLAGEWDTVEGDLLYRTGRSLETLNVRELCSLTYRHLCQGRTEIQVMELDRQLAPPEEKERVVDEVTAQNMRALAAQLQGLQR